MMHMTPRHAETMTCDLLERLQRSESAAYDELVRSNAGWMYAVARRLLGNDADAADAVQEAFTKVWQGLASFRGEAALGTWMKRIVINEALQKLRGRARRPETSLDGLLPRFDDTGHRIDLRDPWQETAEELLCRQETINSVERCVQRLPGAYRTVLVLRDVEELSTEATAEVMGIRAGAVKTRLHRARLALRTLLEREFAGDGRSGASGNSPSGGAGC